MTRDSIVWWLGIVGALVLFLIADGRPPTVWSYMDWLKFVSVLIGTVSGKLATSPLKHSDDVPDKQQAIINAINAFRKDKP